MAFADVRNVLDLAVDGQAIGAHGAFWRNVTRDQFVAKQVHGLPVVVPGNAADSNLIKALRGLTPFGEDIGTPGANMPRMPAWMTAMPEENIQLIECWIDDGCPS